MRRLLIALALGLATVALGVGVALADGGPHGDYDKLFNNGNTETQGITDKCAACHRVHQGVSSSKLLKRSTPYELCVACHDGTVSKLNVLDGVRLTSTVSSRITGTTTNTTLNGGGFEYVNGVTVTSKHNVKTSTATTYDETQPWGYKTNTGVKLETISALSCTSCHNPHGSANYRILKETINGKYVSVMTYYTNTTAGFYKQEGGRGLEGTAGTEYPANKYIADYYGSNGLSDSGGFSQDYDLAGGTLLTDGTSVTSAGMSTVNGFALLCSACHTAYASPGATTALTTNDANGSLTKYRHKIEMKYTDWTSSTKYNAAVPCNPELNPYDPAVAYNPSNPTVACDTNATTELPSLRLASNATDPNKYVTCLTCHRAHGTATSMTGWALKTTFGGASPDEITPSQQNDSLISGGVSKSTLLYTDNRGMCEACHQW